MKLVIHVMEQVQDQEQDQKNVVYVMEQEM